MDQLHFPPYLYLGVPYLARSLSEISKQRCFAYHESFWLSAIRESLAARLRDAGIVLYGHYQGETLYSVVLRTTREHRAEGAMSLEFQVNNVSVYTLSFNVAPGSVFGLEEPDTLLIARMQGTRGEFAHIRAATKALSEVAPQAVLAAVVEGMARALFLSQIVGVAAENSCGLAKANSVEQYREGYDGFFDVLGAAAPTDGFFRLAVPFPQKPANAAKPGHRLRTKKKQELKRLIADVACRALTSALDPSFLAEREKVAQRGASENALAVVNEENRLLRSRLRELERDRDEPKTRPPQVVRLLLRNPVAIVRRLAEWIEVHRLRLLRFDEKFYMESNRDVRDGGARAVLHYVRRGRRELREARFRTFSPAESFPPGIHEAQPYARARRQPSLSTEQRNVPSGRTAGAG